MEDKGYRSKEISFLPFYLSSVRFVVGMIMVMFCAFQLVSSMQSSPNSEQRLNIWQMITAIFSSSLVRQQVVSGGVYFLSVVLLGIGLNSVATIATWPIVTGLLLFQSHYRAGWIPLVAAIVIKVTEKLWKKRSQGNM